MTFFINDPCPLKHRHGVRTTPASDFAILDALREMQHTLQRASDGRWRERNLQLGAASMADDLDRVLVALERRLCETAAP